MGAYVHGLKLSEYPLLIRNPLCEMVCSDCKYPLFRTKLSLPLLALFYLFVLIKRCGAEDGVGPKFSTPGVTKQSKGLIRQSSFHYSSSSWGGALDERQQQDSREVPAIKGVATHHFFEYASQVAVELLKLNFKKVVLSLIITPNVPCRFPRPRLRMANALRHSKTRFNWPISCFIGAGPCLCIQEPAVQVMFMVSGGVGVVAQKACHCAAWQRRVFQSCVLAESWQ